MTEVLFIVSRPAAGPILTALAQACRRRGASWACFFTGAGVETLADSRISGLLPHAEKAIACEHSWLSRMGETPCPAELGSQTNNSELASDAARIISL